ncbi:hypothetical protein [Archangium primigenium]|uniref:hypothetical protein n=1 Tax=[Archangium] primigenium TaxID=2792470 RepID=UPI00195D6063|nr:hypothetical protein [Archangium primigenium]MBM7112241.1 hypothetical protein [Archangium primigenium]
MSIRRVGFNPFVATASLVQAQRRVAPVEKHIGADNPELQTEEDGLDSLNSHYRAELEALEAERAKKAKQVETLRSKLMLRDGYEKLPEELLDLKGGARDEMEQPDPRQAGKPGVSLAQLARANIYERVSREERAAAQRAELERAEAELRAAENALAAQQAALTAATELEEAALQDEPLAEDDAADWMAEELEALQEGAEEDADAEEELYSDPAADLFLASLDDIENLETAPVEDPHAGAFVASLDDIEHLAPEVEVAPEPRAASPSLELEIDVEEPVLLPFDEDEKDPAD